ncbi:MAG: histidine--tRNA ligase [Chthonomonas sp.]|nr:histidine--tRNA ligase [Chthonomonas sp.]
MSYQNIRGTHDILPAEIALWQWLEQTFGALAHAYGYQEIRTPIFEATELFERSSGDTSEVVTKEMYTFLDRKGRSLTLKPEGTAPVIRAYLQHRLGQPNQVTKLWYLTPFFRYERPQKGRFRQPHQFGLELIGAKGPAADAEIIELTCRFYEAVGIKDTVVLLNSIGRSATRAAFRDVLLEHMAGYIETISDEDRAKVTKNPLRLIDTKEPVALELLKSAPQILDYLEDDSRAHFDGVRAALDRAGVKYRLAPEVVRGLDYYTDTVFEVHSEHLGAQGALCGGGRYDGLIQELGGPATPSVGVGIGVERLGIVLEGMGIAREPGRPTAYVVAATPEVWEAVESLVRTLRGQSIGCQWSLDRANLKNQFKEADRLGARFAVVIGTDELAAGKVSLRDLVSGDQSLVDPAELPATFKKE